MVFTNYFGSSGTIAKPRRPTKVDLPDFSSVYNHNTETSFSWISTRLNFLGEMNKFFATYEQDLYASEEADKFASDMREFGDGDGSAFKNEITGVEQEAWGGGERGYTKDSFGSHHRVQRPESSDGLPWGTFEGAAGQNLNFHPAASEFNHFTDEGKYGAGAKDKAKKTETGDSIDNAISSSKYKSLTGYANVDDYSTLWSNGTFNGTQVLSSGVESALANNYGSDSYYQIVMSGFKKGADIAVYDDGNGGEKISWAGDSDKDYTNDAWNADYYGSFDYDSKAGNNGEGAFKLMLGMLESRRRIFSAMTELFGKNTDISKKTDAQATPDEAKLMSNFDAWVNDPKRGGGADPHNMGLLSLFLYSQHSFSSVLPAFINGANWGVASGKDILALDRFGKWMKAGLDQYKTYAGTVNASYATRVNDLENEYYGKKANGTDDTQPYITDPGGTDPRNNDRTGWDCYSVDYNSIGIAAPANIDPKADGPHPSFVVSQTFGINLIGNRTGVVDGKNLRATNWAVHDVLGLKTFQDRDVGRNISISLQNRRSGSKYKIDMQAYYDAKDQAKEDEGRDAAMLANQTAERQAELAKMANQARAKEDEQKAMAAAALKSRVELLQMAKKANSKKKK